MGKLSQKPIMRVVESLVGRFSEGIKTVVRGYSLEDVANAQRIVGGHILPEDRGTHRQELKRNLSGIYFNTSIENASLLNPSGVELYSSWAIQDYQKAVFGIDSLPDEVIDQLLILENQRRLKKWGYPFPQ